MMHSKSGECGYCSDRLLECSELIAAWFVWAKGIYPDLHIAEAFRGETKQHQDYLDDLSHLDWPHSKHNRMENGKPSSRALDVFQIDENGKGIFNTQFYEELYQQSEKYGFPISWGGNFKTLKDYDHFEVEIVVSV